MLDDKPYCNVCHLEYLPSQSQGICDACCIKYQFYFGKCGVFHGLYYFRDNTFTFIHPINFHSLRVFFGCLQILSDGKCRRRVHPEPPPLNSNVYHKIVRYDPEIVGPIRYQEDFFLGADSIAMKFLPRHIQIILKYNHIDENVPDLVCGICGGINLDHARDCVHY